MNKNSLKCNTSTVFDKPTKVAEAYLQGKIGPFSGTRGRRGRSVIQGIRHGFLDRICGQQVVTQQHRGVAAQVEVSQAQQACALHALYFPVHDCGKNVMYGWQHQ